MVKDLIAFGADVNAVDDKQRSMLHYLAQSNTITRLEGALKFVDLLMEEGARPSAQDVDGNTPLHLAISPSIRIEEALRKIYRPNCRSFISILLEHKSDVNLQNNDGVSPFELLIKETANKTSWSYIETFLETGVDISSPASSGNTLFYDFLANLPGQGYTEYAGRSAIRVFLELGADPQTILPSGQPMAQGLFNPENNFSPEEFADILPMLKGVDFNAVRGQGNSIGHDLATYLRRKATEYEFPDGVVDLFFEMNINLNNRNKKGQTPFLFLVSFTWSPNKLLIKLITRCLEAGADLFAEDHLGVCPLVCIARWKTKAPYLDDLLKVYLRQRPRKWTVTVHDTAKPCEEEPEGQRLYWEDWELAADTTDWATARKIFFGPKCRLAVDIDENMRKRALVALADKHVDLISEALAKAGDFFIEKEVFRKISRRKLADIFQDLRAIRREIPGPWLDKLLELC